ncbi:threonine aldolase family protein [Nesterenkonia flava]|uniref:Beta-eliminating lyase-related protein n=1 Tax=Nesterenkonia flava TaxID=469799 RepID=A0ABU1FUQ9_9MICC|nr:beta-eliminating lyase-related protein [Nesterenkonia flava]MDR5712399.1 beta-eliminating lyase-related protein [Nesterenkonia flava]
MGATETTTSASLDASFASDNVAGVSPEILEALQRANSGAALPYGGDRESAHLREWAKAEFGEQAEILPVFNGTGANVVSLQALLPRWGAAICTEEAHVNNDEGAAPERLGAIKLLPLASQDGRLTPEDVQAATARRGDVHAAQALAVTLTQSTELGTLYTPEQIAALTETAHSAGLGVHMDGARISNAASALGTSLAALTTDVGVDVLSLGGTKNGALAAEAVVVINPERVPGVEYIHKYSMQLASKQRFVAAQLLELFGTDLWRTNAAHANAQARVLAEGLASLEGVTLARPTAVNAAFPEMPVEMAARIQSRYLAHTWETAPSGLPVLRIMCSFATTDAQISELLQVARGA